MNPLLIQAIVSAATFIALWIVLGNLVFKPFLALVEEREARTGGDELAAAEKKQQAKAVAAQIESTLRRARTEGITVRDERIQHAKAEAQQIIDRASEQTMKELKKAAQQIADLKAKALAELPAEAEKLSHLVVERALATDAASTIH